MRSLSGRPSGQTTLLATATVIVCCGVSLWALGKDDPQDSRGRQIVERNSPQVPVAPAIAPVAPAAPARNVPRNFVLPTSPDCVDCGEGKLGYVLTGDPEIDAETKRIHWQRIQERRKKMDAELFAKAMEEHSIKRKSWQGTSVVDTNVNDPHAFDSVRQFFPYFQSDPPAPEERQKWFAEYLDPNAKIFGNGWRVLIKSAKQEGEDWLLDVEVFITLVDETPGLVWTDHSMFEQWRVSTDGGFECVSCVPGTAGILAWP